jgi:hypothetical protein
LPSYPASPSRLRLICVQLLKPICAIAWKTAFPEASIGLCSQTDPEDNPEKPLSPTAFFSLPALHPTAWKIDIQPIHRKTLCFDLGI